MYVNILSPSLCATVSGGREEPCSLGLGGGRSHGAARVAAGLAVVPVAAQVDLQRQEAVGGGPILAALVWDTSQHTAMYVSAILRNIKPNGNAMAI